MSKKVYVGRGAVLLGDIDFGRDCSVWPNAVVRGDAGPVRIGDCVNIQENCVLHVSPGHPLEIADGVTVGHGAILHGCRIGRNTMIGMGAVIMNGCEVGGDSIVAAASLLTQGKKYPPGHLIMGSPARAVRELSAEERAMNGMAARRYVASARTELKEEELPDTALILDLLCRRCRSYRRFRQEPVPPGELRAIMENARIASSAGNRQELRYVVVSDPAKVAGLQELVHFAAALPPELGRPKPGEGPVAFVALCHSRREPGPMSEIDMGIAADRIAISAMSRGWGSCIMGAVDAQEIKALLGIPEDLTLRLMIALGRPAHSSTVVEVPESGNLSYFLDGDRNYYVPKRALDDIARFI